MDGNRVAITYDLTADQAALVAVKGSEDGGRTWTVQMNAVSGDVGDAVRPGRGKVLYWDVLRDYPRGYGVAGVVFELSTSGGDFVDPVTGMEFVCIQGGTFEMGDTFGDGGSDEKPVHSVTLSDFCIGKVEVTQAQWEKVMGSNPSNFKGNDRPVEQVSWDDVQGFLQKLNQKSGKKYRLPTEAEWEYAARSGGKQEKWAGTSNENQLGNYAWYNANSGSQTHPVGQKQPNGLGLYDMSGNVWEWCQDWYGSYSASAQRDPQGPSSGSIRVSRGGSWGNDPRDVRSASRRRWNPGRRYDNLGFRLVLSQ